MSVVQQVLATVRPARSVPGITFKNPAWLTREQLPWFMVPGDQYEITEGPTHSRSAPFDIDQIYRYTIREKDGDKKHFFIEAPFDNLAHPDKVFMVVEIKIRAFTFYHYLPDSVSFDSYRLQYPRVE